MRISLVVIAIAAAAGSLAAQEPKPVPKNSVRVSVPGCTKGYIFTAGQRTADQPGSVSIPEGMHLRMNGPKDMIKEIKAREGSMIEITGLVRKGQIDQSGVGIGGGVRISPGQHATTIRRHRWICTFRRQWTRCCASTIHRCRPKRFSNSSGRARSRRSIAPPVRQISGDTAFRCRRISKRRH